MSFLHQLKQQAQSLQSQQASQVQDFSAITAATEAACQRLWHYLDDLHRQLNVIEPAAPALSLDGKAHWPAMKLTGFRFDARKKMLRDQEVFDYLALGWQLLPREAGAGKGRVKVNFPPDLERVERRLRVGHVPHERLEERHPQTNGLQAIVFEHEMAARASVMVTADHDNGLLRFRLACVNGLETVHTEYRTGQIGPAVLDELAKLIVGQPSHFL
ncbi:MAG: hypothetical protein ACR2JA_20280 [Hydrogenophaga sp.]|uniref:hypothetical protein n=1 Tax=Hydrogenophaga sp. TaxID=1904254 RepID=UPI003D9AF8ED